jgi:hypothetical protein
MCACNIKTKKNGNWLGPVMDLFGKLLDLSLENNAFPVALMDLFQKNSSRLIKLIVTARPNLSWHYCIFQLFFPTQMVPTRSGFHSGKKKGPVLCKKPLFIYSDIGARYHIFIFLLNWFS